MPTNKTLMQSESPVTTTDSRPVPDPTVLTTQQLYTAIDSLRTLVFTRLESMDKAVLVLQESSNRSPTVGEIAVQFAEKFEGFTDKFTEIEKHLETYGHVNELRIAEGNGIHRTKIEGLEKRLDHKYVETAADIAHLRDLVGERIKALDNIFKAVDKQFESIAEISRERFIRIDQSFIERDKRTDQLTLASSTAIAAALQAQKEAAGETQKSSAAAIAKSETATSESIKSLQTLFQTSISGLSTQILDVKSRLDKGEGQGAGRIAATDDSRYERGARRDENTDTRGLIATVVGIAGILISIGTLILLVSTRH